MKKPYSCADTTCAQDIDWDLLANDTFKADAEGFRFSLHAQGDAAISKVLDIYDSCQKDENGKLIKDFKLRGYDWIKQNQDNAKADKGEEVTQSGSN